MRVLIVGGGIGGLTLCAFLRRSGFEVVLVERETTWTTIGYVLGIFPNGYNILADLGAAAAIRRKAVELKSFTMKNGEGDVIWKSDFDELIKEVGPVLEVEREHVHDVLRSINAGADIRTGTTIESFEDRGEDVLVRFADGTEDVFDLVVGADGSNSTVRKSLFPKAEKSYSGFTFWLTWVERTFPKPEGPIYYFGDRTMVGIFPTADEKRVGALFLLPAAAKAFERDASREHLRTHFRYMRGEVPALLDALPASDHIYHADDDEILLKEWHRGRVALLGDAVHAISPVLGLGASMAMEDAYVLSQELIRADTIELALHRYVRRRLPRVKFLSRWSYAVHNVLSIGSHLYRPRNIFVTQVFSPGSDRLMRQFLRRQP